MTRLSVRNSGGTTQFKIVFHVESDQFEMVIGFAAIVDGKIFFTKCLRTRSWFVVSRVQELMIVGEPRFVSLIFLQLTPWSRALVRL